MELHPATLWESFSDAFGDRLAIVHAETRTTWRQFDDRAARLAAALQERGVGPGAKVGQLLYNSPAYLESYFAALKLRAVPFNVNFRYTATEVAYLLTNADAEALVYHSTLGPIVAAAVAEIGPLKALIEVDDGGRPLDRSLRYEDAIAQHEPAARVVRDPDDVTMVYTGGTTGMPKGVVIKVGPPLQYVLETVPPLAGMAPQTIDSIVDTAATVRAPDLLVSLPASPLMHNTGLGIGVAPALGTGGTVVLLANRHFDPAELWDTVERERVNAITIVGDPFARPMLAELRAHPTRDLACVRSIASAGAMFSAEVKTGLLEHLPQAMILDIIAASEGSMGMAIATADAPGTTGQFHAAPGVIVVTPDDRPIEPGSGEPGLVALPGGAEGYFKDDAKTAATFKVIDGIRYTIPGDWATVGADGTLTLLGRGSSCINTAGEKVFPEEVEEALKALPAVEDALVFGLPDERFGQRVAAVISRSSVTDGTVTEMLDALRTQLAAYKLPRAVVVVDEVPRTQVGKPDYPTARTMFDAGTAER
jgi:fatty-acyl-CoA synthase